MLGYKWKRVRLSLKDKRDQVLFDKQQLELEQLKRLHQMKYIDILLRRKPFWANSERWICLAVQG